MQLTTTPSPGLIQQDVLLAPFTSFGIGGAASFFAAVTSEEELLEAVRFAQKNSLPIVVIGGGSNLLVSDSGFDGLVIQVQLRAAIVRTGNDFAVAAGTDWDEFVLEICQLGISGVECLAGIPGLVGGSPIQNIGAYGQEAAQTIRSVTALDLTSLERVILPRDACGFAYRTSIFNTTHRSRYIVTSVTFRLDPAAEPNLSYADLKRHFEGKPAPSPIEIYHAVRGIRQAKGMLLLASDPDSHSAGSFFKNPIVPGVVLGRIAEAQAIDAASIPNWPAGEGMVKLPAAWLLERAGFYKGFAMGAAGISSRHTLAIINRGGAKFGEIVALREVIVRVVGERFGIVLEQEPVQIGS